MVCFAKVVLTNDTGNAIHGEVGIQYYFGSDNAEIPPGGIDLNQQAGVLHIEKDPNGGVKVNVDQAMIQRVEQEGGLVEVVPVIINMQPANVETLFR